MRAGLGPKDRNTRGGTRHKKKNMDRLGKMSGKNQWAGLKLSGGVVWEGSLRVLCQEAGSGSGNVPKTGRAFTPI